ncbi:MAG TPA: RNA polymerase sigma factor [Candidatus Dormibacteraeota bacterium]|nr:RNA polymerase sigma factor [Candidatus Dormibacteraeota bacterium]
MDIAESYEVTKAGERRLFVALLEPVLPGAYHLAFGMLRSEADAEDAVQEAVLSAWKHFKRFRPGSDVRPWLLKIVANQCRGQLRNRWNGVVKEPLVTPAATAAALDAQDLDLRRALGNLPYDQRLVLVLRYYLDLSFEEVGKTLGVSTKAAKSRTHRALERLRLMPEVYTE